MSPTFTLVLGGARSGKSAHAEKLAAEAGERVLYVATAEARDEEMGRRIEKHRRGRPSTWETLEVPLGVGAAVRSHPGSFDAVLLDCFTLLAGNVFGLDEREPVAEERLTAEIEALFETFEAGEASWIVVSNEVGLGIVPETPLGRVYRDVIGRAHQELARRADAVYFLVAGLPMRVK